jgi:hypothetical protein
MILFMLFDESRINLESALQDGFNDRLTGANRSRRTGLKFKSRETLQRANRRIHLVISKFPLDRFF